MDRSICKCTVLGCIMFKCYIRRIIHYNLFHYLLIYSRSWDYKTNFHNYNTYNRLILVRHVGWGMRSSYFMRILVKQWLAISETMTDQIVWKVLIALMTDLSADRSISLCRHTYTHTDKIRRRTAHWNKISLWGHLHFWGCLHFWACLRFCCHLHFWGRLYFLVTRFQCFPTDDTENQAL